MLGLVGDIAAEVPPHDAVPGGIVLLIKLLKDNQKGKKKIIQDHRFNVMITTACNSIPVCFEHAIEKSFSLKYKLVKESRHIKSFKSLEFN